MADREDLRIVFEADLSHTDDDFIHDQLGVFNIKSTGFADYAPAHLLLRDADNKVRGGLLAYVWAKWLHVDTFWLPEDLRGQGWGTKLLEEAHRIGREKGAEAAWLDTFSWQARPFYERFGYEAVFEVSGFPPGHSRIFMQMKPL